MNFIRTIVNNEELLSDADIDELMSTNPELLDEDAIDRIAKRVDSREIAYYAMLVGKTNALKAKLAKDRIVDGKTVPANFANGYSNVAEMVNDIVQAGPSYITLLKNLHQRAKRTR